MPRIIAGEFRGRRLAAPADSTRPTSDRVREAIASMLGARMDIAGVRVLDLYAGTGALALEALSRGAESAVLVDADRRAAAVARENIAVCGAQSRARVVQRTAAAFLAAPGERYDLVFLDPPYALSSAEVAGALAALRDHLAPDAWVVLERASRSDDVVWPDGLEPVAAKTYGDTTVTLGRPEY
ncbi:16S rRNA (guanine(966)-N(2))-methyltransferase RsmD [Gordonia sp. PP30]|uniref:16S rRNA (guanine(966)-N(2))-methyltransferase RsmD n=1 Tax=Gordonia sp. PP30 TaxID=2935861 RepID=UPI001FFF9F4F|nr:16S rRNA (guanine(966)-N(2))-methyltransferase RsmD [Gordonia sp. PP30]UQE76569.1 16S rRNA (guanine(966)-N(2))-methyltransferase RsmD [Gordonia sp. PP30]